MPTIDVDCAELERLLGWTWQGDMDKLDWLLAFVKSEVKFYNEHEGYLETFRPYAQPSRDWLEEVKARLSNAGS